MVQHVIDNKVIKTTSFIDGIEGKIPVPVVADEYFFDHPAIIDLIKRLNAEYPKAKVRFNY